MVKVKIWRISDRGKTVWAIAEFPSRERAIKWATDKICGLMRMGYLAIIQFA